MATIRELARHLIAAVPARLTQPLAALQHKSPGLRRLYVFLTRWMRTGDAVISHGPGAGLRFNPSGANPGYSLGTNEPAVQAAIAAHVRPGLVFFDLGANVGFHTVIGARCAGPTGRVVAFEPLPSNAAAVRRNVALNGFTNVTVIEAAVAAGEGRANLTLGEEPGWGASR